MDHHFLPLNFESNQADNCSKCENLKENHQVMASENAINNNWSKLNLELGLGPCLVP